jgi:hypothetical protein
MENDKLKQRMESLCEESIKQKDLVNRLTQELTGTKFKLIENDNALKDLDTKYKNLKKLIREIIIDLGTDNFDYNYYNFDNC